MVGFEGKPERKTNHFGGSRSFWFPSNSLRPAKKVFLFATMAKSRPSQVPKSSIRPILTTHSRPTSELEGRISLKLIMDSQMVALFVLTKQGSLQQERRSHLFLGSLAFQLPVLNASKQILGFKFHSLGFSSLHNTHIPRASSDRTSSSCSSAPPALGAGPCSGAARSMTPPGRWTWTTAAPWWQAGEKPPQNPAKRPPGNQRQAVLKEWAIIHFDMGVSKNQQDGKGFTLVCLYINASQRRSTVLRSVHMLEQSWANHGGRVHRGQPRWLSQCRQRRPLRHDPKQTKVQVARDRVVGPLYEAVIGQHAPVFVICVMHACA